MAEEAPSGTPVDSRRLLCFVAAVEAGSAPQGAERLGVGASWITAQIRALERTLGTTLAQRQCGRLTATEAGQALLSRAGAVIDRQERFAAAVAALRRAERGELRLGASRLSVTLPERLQLTRELTGARPDLRLSVHEGDSQVLLEALVRGSDDLAFALAPWDRRHRGVALRTLVLRRGTRALVGPAGHALAAGSGPVALHELTGERVAAFPRTAHAELFDRTYRPLAAAGVEICQERENHPRALINRVLSRGELTIVSAWMVPELVAGDRGLWARPVSGMAAGDDLCLVARSGDDSPLAAAAWAIAERAFGGAV